MFFIMSSMFQLNGRRVYTTSKYTINKVDLERSQMGLAIILDAYFFQFQQKEGIKMVDFDKNSVSLEKTGLYVILKSQFGAQTSFPLKGLETITNFLYDANAIGNLSAVKGKNVLEYNHAGPSIGIAMLKNNEQKSMDTKTTEQ